MSGGVTVSVTGLNLNSVASPRLILTLSRRVDDKSEAYNYISDCSLVDESTKMTCKTPDVTDAISRRRETGDKNNYITAELQIDMDGADAMATLAEPHQMRVHQDPALYPILADSDDAHISSPLRDFTIRGQNIPTWIDWADISVTIGETTCPVTAVTQDLISCDVTNVLKMYKKDSLILDNDNKHNDGSVRTTSTPGISDSNTTQPATEQANTTTVSITSRRVRHRRELSSNNMMLLSMILVPDNSSNITDNSVNATEMEMNFTTTTSLPVTDTTTDKTPDSQSHRKLLSYLVMARIGNYEATLGNVTVGPRNESETWVDPETDPRSGKLDFTIIAGAGGAGFLVLVLIVIACAMYCRAKKARALVKDAFYMGSLSGSQHGSREAATMSLKQILESVIEPHKRADLDKLIISLDRLTVGKSIGSGNFGCVYEGLLESKDDSPTVKVAVKTLQDPLSHNINLQEFVQEAVIMKDFRHPHVLGLVGLAEKEPGVPYVILPYMDSGDLLTFIRDTSVSLSLHDVIKFGADIASGMAYLSALKFVHRDLAARNCMLDSVHRVKVADFGLCRDIYEKGYYTSDNKKKLPIRWMAMESIEQGAYSTKSDAWSLGVVLWELLTRGVTPYPGVDGWDIINFLRFRRLAPPFFCPEELYNLMMQCWAKDPNMRPTFTVIQTELLKMIGQTPAAADTMTPTLKRSHALSTQSVSSNKSAEDTLSKQNPNAPKPLPRTTVKQKSDEKPEAQPRRHLWKDSEKAGENKEEKDKEKGDSDTVVESKQKVLKNVMITIPACYAHRDVSRTAAGTYIQLVDNYEPPPKFSHPLKRSKKKSSKRTAERQGADNQKGEQSPKTITGAYSVPENNAPLRSSAGSYLTDNPDAGVRGSEGSLIGRVGREGSYYVLERDSIRTSDTSDMDSRTSSMLMNTDSMPSLRDSHSHSRCSSTYSGSRASGISNLSALNTHRHSNTASHAGPAVHKKSPLAVTTRKSAWEDVQEQSEGASEETHDLMTSL